MLRLSCCDRQTSSSFLSSDAPRLSSPPPPAGGAPDRLQSSPYGHRRSSVEALAAVLVPVAVDHQPDDQQEDAAQQGEEHGEKNGDPTHPFFILAHWEGEQRRFLNRS